MFNYWSIEKKEQLGNKYSLLDMSLVSNTLNTIKYFYSAIIKNNYFVPIVLKCNLIDGGIL